MFLLYAALTGITFSFVLLAYTQQSITLAFVATAGSFLGLSLFGYTTKRDLGPIGAFCFMGLLGLIIVYDLSYFISALNTSTAQLITSTIGVIVFAGLTAYDTQRIKSYYNKYVDKSDRTKLIIDGALNLYLDFVNLFLLLLSFGNRK